MTQEEIMRMAREAGIIRAWTGLYEVTEDEIAELAQLVEIKAVADFLERSGQYLTNDATREAALAEARAEERKACVMVCYDLPMPDDFRGSGDATWEFGTLQCADAIRARGAP